jgi:hypothetical protein
MVFGVVSLALIRNMCHVTGDEAERCSAVVANGDLYLFISFLPALNVEIGSE